MNLRYRRHEDGSVHRYVMVTYEQRWGMESWINQNADLVGRAFSELDQIQWLHELGYTGTVARHHDVYMDNFHIKMSFEIPEQVLTMMTLKWPDEVAHVDFAGPTMIESREYATQGAQDTNW